MEGEHGRRQATRVGEHAVENYSASREAEIAGVGVEGGGKRREDREGGGARTCFCLIKMKFNSGGRAVEGKMVVIPRPVPVHRRTTSASPHRFGVSGIRTV